MGRTLPNMFALLPGSPLYSLTPHRCLPITCPVNLAISLLVAPSRRRAWTNRSAICIVAVTTVIFRAELALFLAPLTCMAAVKYRSSVTALVVAGILSGLSATGEANQDFARAFQFSAAMSIAATVLIDSYFWSKYFMWPELSAAYFNVYQGKSAEWGVSFALSGSHQKPPIIHCNQVSPRHAYFTVHLPKLLMAAWPLALLGVLVDRRARNIAYPAIAFICLISQLEHKEWRFIVYMVPVFNIAAARGAAWM